MLNLVSFDITDQNILDNSYKAFRNKENIEIIIDIKEKEQVFRQTIDNVKIPKNANFSFQNLFKIKVTNGHFYVAQCLVDFEFPIGTRGA